MMKSLLVADLAAALGVFVSMQGDTRDAEAQPGNAGPLAADIPDFRVPDGERFGVALWTSGRPGWVS